MAAQLARRGRPRVRKREQKELVEHSGDECRLFRHSSSRSARVAKLPPTIVELLVPRLRRSRRDDARNRPDAAKPLAEQARAADDELPVRTSVTKSAVGRRERTVWPSVLRAWPTRTARPARRAASRGPSGILSTWNLRLCMKSSPRNNSTNQGVRANAMTAGEASKWTSMLGMPVE